MLSRLHEALLKEDWVKYVVGYHRGLISDTEQKMVIMANNEVQTLPF